TAFSVDKNYPPLYHKLSKISFTILNTTLKHHKQMFARPLWESILLILQRKSYVNMSETTINTSSSTRLKVTIASYVFFTFFGYLCIGLPLAVLPIYITKELGYSTVMAGIVISLQYVATFLTRGWSGNLIDKKGPRLSVYISMGCLALSGVLLYLTYLSRSEAMASLAILIIARLVTG